MWNRIDGNRKGKKASKAKFLDPKPKYMVYSTPLK
jgi:hypothetical protein